MKAESLNEETKEFKPVAFKITCHTQSELDFWYNLFQSPDFDDVATDWTDAPFPDSDTFIKGATRDTTRFDNLIKKHFH